jgi:hypothetical protein
MWPSTEVDEDRETTGKTSRKQEQTQTRRIAVVATQGSCRMQRRAMD